MNRILPVFLLSLPAWGAQLSVLAENYQYQEAPEYQAILFEMKTYGNFSHKGVVDKEVPIVKTLSRGEQIVAEMKARNKALIAEQTMQEKKMAEETVGQLSGPDQWKKQVKETQDSWKKQVKDQLKAWRVEQEIFLGRLKVYKENTFVLPVKTEKIIEKKVTLEDVPEVFVVNRAFQVPIRDQQARATCSAFAGVRALEIILAQNKIEEDLSEQYFYWASKPACLKSPCSEKGSWVGSGLDYSRGRPVVDIPTETQCVYQTQSVANNETQIPLATACSEGVTKVVNYEEVRTLAEVIQKIKSHTPVIMAAKLSENFYKNSGLIKAQEANKGGQLDSHAKGHAFLAVGVMGLPEKLIPTEGSYCLIIANSWGKGWGAGGYSCVTENWLLKYRQPSPFLAVTKISVK